MSVLCDGLQPQVRQAAVATLNAWVDHTGILPLVENDGLTDIIKTENPFLRSEVTDVCTSKTQPTDFILSHALITNS